MALDAGAAVMVTSHLGRPTEGEFKPEDSLAPVASAPGRAARPRRAAGAGLGRRRRRRAGRGRAARELPPQQGREEERPGAGAGRWPRCATSSSTTPSAPRIAPRPRPTASPSSRRSPAPARCWPPRSTPSRKALAAAEAAAGRDRRRQQGLDQADDPAEPGGEGRPADRRRRHRQHLPARRGPADRQEPGRARPGRRGAAP